MPKIYGYGRASTDAQKPSLVRQRQGIDAFIESQKAIGRLDEDCEYVGFFEDEDVSGSVFWKSRGCGMQINATLEEGDVVIVTHFDRMFRNVADCSLTVADFNERGIRLIMMDVQVDSQSSNGRMVLNVLASLKEHERDSIVERITCGIKHRTQLCKVMIPPHGWKKISGNHYVPCEKTRALTEKFAERCLNEGAVTVGDVNRIGMEMPGINTDTTDSLHTIEMIMCWAFGFPLMTKKEIIDTWDGWVKENLKARLLPKVRYRIRTMPFIRALYIWRAMGKEITPDPDEITKSRLQELVTVRNMRKVGAPALINN